MKGKRKLPDNIQEIQDDKLDIIGKRIVDLSDENNITVDTLAEKIGISSDQVKKYRSGTSAPSIGTLFYLSSNDVFDCDVDYILGILPEGQKTYKAHDLHELTGLDPDACEILEKRKEIEEADNDLSWFLKNGFLDITDKILSLRTTLNRVNYYHDHLPKQLRDLMDTIIKNDDKEGKISFESSIYLSKWIHPKSNTELEIYNDLLRSLYLDSNYETSYEYCFNVPDTHHVQTEDEREKDQELDLIQQEINDLYTEGQIEKADKLIMQYYDMDRNIHGYIENIVYKRVSSLINEYLHLNRIKQITQYDLSTTLSSITNRYLDSTKNQIDIKLDKEFKSIFDNANKELLKEGDDGNGEH